jgi:hypothetical protein
MDVISSSGGATSTFIGVGTSTYSPGLYGSPEPNSSLAGFASEPSQELMMAMTLATGDDAYGLCPGGTGVEATNSNTVLCVNHPTDPSGPYGTCGDGNVPIFAPVNTAPPTITGTPAVGQTLTEVHGTWKNGPTGYKYQWLRCDSSGSNCQPISGATGSKYKLAAADVGSTIKVNESASNRANTEGPATSAATAVVTAAGGSGGSGGSGGGTGGGGSGGTGGGSKFIVGKLRLSKYAFLAAKGTSITWQDTKSATSTLTVTKKGGTKVIWTATHKDSSGGNSFRFRDKKLRRGFYTLTLRTTHGGQTKTNSVTMRIVA